MRDAVIRVFRPENLGDPERGAVYRVRIDGRIVGDLWTGQSVAQMVSSGEHRIQVLANQSVDWLRSKEVTVNADPNQPVALRCTLRRGFALLHPKDYLTLEVLSPEASNDLEAQTKSAFDTSTLPPRDLRPLLKEGEGLPGERLPDVRSPDDH
jgi:hypothetical protein